MLLMIIGCLVPMLLIFFILPAFGVSGGVTLVIFIVLMFACHFLMLGRHRGGEDQDEKHDHYPRGLGLAFCLTATNSNSLLCRMRDHARGHTTRQGDYLFQQPAPWRRRYIDFEKFDAGLSDDFWDHHDLYPGWFAGAMIAVFYNLSVRSK